MKTYAIWIISGLLVSGPATAEIINQKNPAYQASLEHLSRAAQLIDKADKEISAARRTHKLPGIDYVALNRLLGSVSAQLKPVLYPEHRRQRYHQFTPDAAFFSKSPYNLGEEIDIQQ